MHVGTWGLAAVVIVIASWLMYRYLAPANWKEWTRAGVLQAFIIAFYAEMYGFPLTIYFLARFFGLDLPWTEGGNLWAQVFGTPVAHLVAMVIGYTIVFSGASLVADGWRRVFPIGLNTVGRTLTHIMICEWAYLERLRGRAPSRPRLQLLALSLGGLYLVIRKM